LFSPDHKEPAFTFLALLNADGQLELTIVGDSARDMLGLRPGMEVVVKW
jgi:S-adenosylmethionine hydrolase